MSWRPPDPAQGGRPGEERPPRRDEPGAEPSRWAFDRGLGTGRGARGDARVGTSSGSGQAGHSPCPPATAELSLAAWGALSGPPLEQGAPTAHRAAGCPISASSIRRSTWCWKSSCSGSSGPRCPLVSSVGADRAVDCQRGCGDPAPHGVDLLPRWALAPVALAVQALRGISIPGVITLIAEIGSFSRFENPRQLMAYLGLVPSERSSGSTTRRGPITPFGKRGTGNSLARTCPRPGSGGRGRLDLPLCGTSVADHPRALRAFARADPGGGEEGPGQALPALSPPDGHRQGRAQGGHRHRPRTGRLHLGHRPHGGAGAHLIEHLQRHQPAKQDTRPENAQRG